MLGNILLHYQSFLCNLLVFCFNWNYYKTKHWLGSKVSLPFRSCSNPCPSSVLKIRNYFEFKLLFIRFLRNFLFKCFENLKQRKCDLHFFSFNQLQATEFVFSRKCCHNGISSELAQITKQLYYLADPLQAITKYEMETRLAKLQNCHKVGFREIFFLFFLFLIAWNLKRIFLS